MRRLARYGMAAALALPAAVWAKAPEPRKPIEVAPFMGRWHEILYTPSSFQKDCAGASQVWTQAGPNTFAVTLTCQRGGAAGKDRTVNMTATAIDPNNTKYEASFFGGLIKQRYWVLDHADDYSWMIACTSGGNFAALLSRRPTMAAGEVEAHKAQMAAMRLNTEKLVATVNTP